MQKVDLKDSFGYQSRDPDRVLCIICGRVEETAGAPQNDGSGRPKVFVSKTCRAKLKPRGKGEGS